MMFMLGFYTSVTQNEATFYTISIANLSMSLTVTNSGQCLVLFPIHGTIKEVLLKDSALHMIRIEASLAVTNITLATKTHSTHDIAFAAPVVGLNGGGSTGCQSGIVRGAVTLTHLMQVPQLAN